MLWIATCEALLRANCVDRTWANATVSVRELEVHVASPPTIKPITTMNRRARMRVAPASSRTRDSA